MGSTLVSPAAPPFTTNYLYFEKMHWAGNYLPLQIYNSQDLVNSGGALYVSKVPGNEGHDPATSPTWWDALPGGGSSNVSQFPYFLPAAYDWLQRPGGSLSAGVPATISLTPCPPGVYGAGAGYYCYISGGSGAPEAVLVTGGTAPSGLSSGTIQFTPANSHSGNWTISSASGGLAEALQAASAGPGGVIQLTAPIIARAQITIPASANYCSFIIQGVGPAANPAGTAIIRGPNYPAGDILLYDQSLGPGAAAVTIRDLSIYNGGPYGSRIHNGSGAAIHIRGNTAFSVHIERVFVESGWMGFNIDSSVTVSVEGCNFSIGQDYTFPVWAALQITNTSGVGELPEAKITNCDFNGSITTGSQLQFCIAVLYADGLQVSGNHFAFANIGMGFPINTGTQIDIVTIADNEFDTFATSAISFFNNQSQTPLLVGPITIEGNDIANQHTGSAAGISIGAGANIDGLQIVGNRIYRNGSDGILIQAGAVIGPVQIVGNAIFDNNINNGFACGVVLEDTMPHDYTITGNAFYNSRSSSWGPGYQNVGLQVNSGFANSLVTANNFHVPTGAAAQMPITLGAAAVSAVIRNNAGIDDVCPAIASAATLAFPLNPNFTVTGATGATAVNMMMVPPNSSGTFRTTSGPVTFTAGGGIGNTFTSVAGVPVIWTWDGTSLWLK